MSKLRRHPGSFSLAGLICAGPLALAPQAMAQDMDKVVIAYPQAVSVTNSDFGFGVRLGIFEEEGIDLEVIGLDGSAIMVPQVANGTITAALAHPDYLLSSLDKGNALPVRFVYNWRRYSPYEIIVMEDSEIQDVS